MVFSASCVILVVILSTKVDEATWNVRDEQVA